MTVRRLLWTTSVLLLAVAALGSWALAADRTSETTAREEARQIEPEFDDSGAELGIDPFLTGECGKSTPPTAWLVIPPPAPGCEDANLQLTAVASRSGGGAGTYGPALANNGIFGTGNSPSCCVSGNCWHWISAGMYPTASWFELTWPSPVEICQIWVDTKPLVAECGCGYNRALHASDIQTWNGTAYVTEGSVTNATDDWMFVMPNGCRTTTRLRLNRLGVVSSAFQNSNPILYELKVYGCAPQGCTPDRQAPRITPPAGGTFPCDAIPPVPPLSSVIVTDNCDVPPPAPVYVGETRTAGNCPGNYTLSRTWRATDLANNTRTASQVLTIRDTVGPTGVDTLDPLACVWPPNHTMVAVDGSGIQPTTLTDNCGSTPFTFRINGLNTDQCDNAPCSQYPGQNGDGETTGDFFLPEGGQTLVVRSERCGTEEGGRHYGVLLTATDSCGNVGRPFLGGSVLVPHDSSDIPAGMTCVDASKAGTK